MPPASLFICTTTAAVAYVLWQSGSSFHVRIVAKCSSEKGRQTTVGRSKTAVFSAFGRCFRNRHLKIHDPILHPEWPRPFCFRRYMHNNRTFCFYIPLGKNKWTYAKFANIIKLNFYVRQCAASKVKLKCTLSLQWHRFIDVFRLRVGLVYVSCWCSNYLLPCYSVSEKYLLQTTWTGTYCNSLRASHLRIICRRGRHLQYQRSKGSELPTSQISLPVAHRRNRSTCL